MATYAIGDLQGCYASLERLQRRIRFDPARDRLWIAGDLVNRGPGSLDVLRWARDLGPALTCVLGNHDLHLLAVALGQRKLKRLDTLEAVLQAPDRDELLDWLAARPLLHREGRFLLVHAGVHPSWDLAEAEARAREVEQLLAGPQRLAALAALQSEHPENLLPGGARLQESLRVFTQMRMLREDGSLDREHKGSPADAAPGLEPWFERPRHIEETVLCGHWSALGLHVGEGVVALDTGCVWGRELTAYRLEDGAVFQEVSAERG